MKEVKQARNNPEIVEEINQPSKPNTGARLVAGKNSANAEDSLGHPPKQNVHEFDAKESTTQSHRKSVNRQIGETAIPVPKGHATSQDDSNT